MNGEDTGQDHQHHHHYDHYSPAMAARLDGFYGRVDERLNARIAAWVTGKSVLDVGCGFGQLVDSLRKRGFDSVGVDLLPACIEAGKQRFPQSDLRVAKSESLEFPDKSFDTVVLKDTIHHVYEEDDVAAFLADVRRVARKRLIILDPNPTAILSRRSWNGLASPNAKSVAPWNGSSSLRIPSVPGLIADWIRRRRDRYGCSIRARLRGSTQIAAATSSIWRTSASSTSRSASW